MSRREGGERHGREANREPHLIVMPESKLWAGVYACFHHAFKGARQMPDPSQWFVVHASWIPPGFEGWTGWLQSHEPHALRVPSKGDRR